MFFSWGYELVIFCSMALLDVLLPELISAALTNSLLPIQANFERKFAFIEGKISQMESKAAEKCITGQGG